MVNIIDSTQNEKIKRVVKLSSSSRYRKQKGEFVLEGLRLCRDAADCGVKIKQVFFTTNIFEKNQEDIRRIIAKSDSANQISPQVCSKLSTTQTSQGVFCVCQTVKQFSQSDISYSGKYIVLENIQDPANLGAICRTAEALGISGAIIEAGCDIYNPKAQRAAMGSLLRLPVINTDNLLETLTILKTHGMKIYATTPDSTAKDITCADLNPGLAVVIGNEGNGVSQNVLELCQPLTIPMHGNAQSLNASMAAAIVMWELVRDEK